MSLIRASVVALFALTIFPAAAQTTAATPATTAPRTWDFFGHYNKRVAAIEADLATLDAGSTNVIVLLGDSITEAFKVKELCGRRVVNMGISGDQIAITTQPAGVLRRAELVAKAKPKDIFLMIGINDFGSGKSLEDAQAQYRELVEKLSEQSADAKLHIQSVLPTSGRFAKHLPKVNAMNEFLKKLAAEKQVEYIDLFSLMADEKGEIREEYTTEGLHLKAAAYEVWQKELERRLGCAH